MRFQILLASVFAFAAVGCGKGYSSSKVNFKSTGADLSSEAANDNTPVTPAQQPQLKTEELGQILSIAGGSLTRFVTNLQGLGGGNFNFTGSSASINKNLPCETSGSVNVTASGSTSASVSLTEISASLSGGMGTVTFTACTFPNPRGGTIRLDGTASLNSMAGNFKIVMNGVVGGKYTFDSTHQVATVGTIQVTTSELTKSCEFSSSQQSVLNGTIDPANNYALNATATSTIQATICGTTITL
jgi:hypothetical protein